MLEVAAAKLQHGLEIDQHLARLLAHAALHGLAHGRIDAHLAGGKDEAVPAHAGEYGPAGLGAP